MYVPYMRRNLISIFLLAKWIFLVYFNKVGFELIKSSFVVGNGLIFYGLHVLLLSNKKITIHVDTIGQKLLLLKVNSSKLWHKHLGDISRKRIEHLAKE